MISLIAAVARNNALGKDNNLLYSLPEDMKYFKNNTLGKICIMGRKTFQSIGQPLPVRTNIILTHDESFHVNGCYMYNHIEDILDEYDNYALPDEEVMVIGGAEVYKLFLPYADRLYLTHIDHNFEADAFFPEINYSQWELVSSKKGIKDEKNPYDYCFNVYERI